MATRVTWSTEQEVVVTAPCTDRILVEAGPGTGKTAVACGRVAYLVDSEDVTPSRILLVSFTRTAVAELRQRIVDDAVNKDSARSVEISTIDSHAWRFRAGFEAEETQALDATLDYTSNIKRSLGLIEQEDSEARAYIQTLEHLIVDEAQDVVGVRADFLLALIRNLDPECGITIFGDSAQAIYDFTNRIGAGARASVFSATLRDAGLVTRVQFLTGVYRTRNRPIIRLFERLRKMLLEEAPEACGRESVASLAGEIASEASGRYPRTKKPFLDDLEGCEDTLVLFRTRVEVVLASSLLTSQGVHHRLRLPGLPIVVYPWIALVFREWPEPRISRADFEIVFRRWQRHEYLANISADVAWVTLYRLCGVSSTPVLDLLQLRGLVVRSRPPVELCSGELGSRGPILSTIHASKGREAETVRLMLPTEPGYASFSSDDYVQDWSEERRVLYVGATRVRENLVVSRGFESSNRGRLKSGRAWRSTKDGGAQVHIGIDGDMDPLAHVRFEQAQKVQQVLAMPRNGRLALEAHRVDSRGYVYEVRAVDAGTGVIGQLDSQVNNDLFEIASKYEKKYTPRVLRHMCLFAVTTAAVSPEDAEGLKAPYCDSGFFLSPIVQGFMKTDSTNRTKVRSKSPRGRSDGRRRTSPRRSGRR